MRMHSSRALIALALILVIAATASGKRYRPGLRKHTFQQDGLKRRYLVYTPFSANRLRGKRPLVIVLHGGGGNDYSMVGLTQRRFNRLADKHGFYVVFPNAYRAMWDFGAGRISASLNRRVNDEAYFQRVLDQVLADFPIDRQRVFATGISRGGQACYFLAGKFPQRIRAIAPVTMPLPKYMLEYCRQGPPIGLALFNGTGDPAVPYEGGWIQLKNKKRDQVLSTERTLELWRRRNGCSQDEPSETEIIDKPGDNTSVTRMRWSCSGAPVTLYRIENGGHTWPGGDQYLSKDMIGEVCHDIDGADEIWRFFSQF